MLSIAKIHLLATSFVLATVALGACDSPEPNPIIGSWVSADRVAGEYNELEIDSDLEGEATIHFYFADEAYFADFDVVAEPQGGGEYELEFECQGGCGELDFDAECELRNDELECEGDNGWEDYEFKWELD